MSRTDLSRRLRSILNFPAQNLAPPEAMLRAQKMRSVSKRICPNASADNCRNSEPFLLPSHRGTNVARSDCADAWIGPLAISGGAWRSENAVCANANRARKARTSLTIQENGLSDRRGARSAMRCYEILCVEELER